MPNLLQSISANNQISTFQTVQPIVKYVAPQVKSENNTQSAGGKDYFSNRTLYGSLVGLAAIGSGIFLISKKLKNPVKSSLSNVVQSEQISGRIQEISDKINGLKKLIYNDYISKRKFMTEKFVAAWEEIGVEPFADGKELQQRLNIRSIKYQDVLDSSGKIIEENKNLIKERLKTLGKDSDFIELRKLRKSLMNTINTAKTEDEVKIAREKLFMVNDLLINKVYPEEAERFAGLYNMEESAIRKLVGDNFASYNDFIAKYNSIKSGESDFDFAVADNGFNHFDKLRFIDVFPKEAKVIVANREIVQAAKDDLWCYQSLQKSYSTVLSELAESYRQTEGVAELKSLVEQLNSLKNSLNNAA